MKRLTLTEIQNLEFEMLKDFHNFCQNNELKYSLAYGTLIGAIRHKDFIPWDDDIDVVMLREDYDKFLKLTKEKYLENYEVLSYEYTENYIYPFAKISNTKTLIHEPTIMKIPLGIYIDIFPLDNIPSELRELKKLTSKIKILTKSLIICSILWKEVLPIIKSKNKKILANVIRYSISPIFKIYGYKNILKMIFKEINKSKEIKSEYASNLTGNIIKEKIRKKSFGSLIKSKFRDSEFYIFSNYDEILKNYYGDYKVIPPVEKRKNHNMKAFLKE